MSAIVNFITFSLSSCESRDVIASFFEKITNFPEVHFKGYHCFITLTVKIVITSINSVSNLVVTGVNLLRNHQMKISVILYLLSINQKFNLKRGNTTGIVKNIWCTICSCWLEKSRAYIWIWKIEQNRQFSFQSSIAMATIKLCKGSDYMRSYYNNPRLQHSNM